MEFFCWFFCSSRCCPKKKGEYAQLRAQKKSLDPVHRGRKELAELLGCWARWAYWPVGLLVLLAGLAGLRACWPAGLLPCLLFLSLILFLSSTSLLLLPLSFFFFFSIPREASKQFSFYFIQDSHVSSLKLFLSLNPVWWLERNDNLGPVGFSGTWAFNFLLVHFIFTLKYNIKFRLYKINIMHIK